MPNKQARAKSQEPVVLDRSDFLAMKNKPYREVVADYLEWALGQDLAKKGDITTSIFLTSSKKEIKAQVRSRNNEGILAGREELEFFLESKKIDFKFHYQDGEKFPAQNQVLLTIQSQVTDVLVFERLILNFLQRMISIATNTEAFCARIREITPHAKIASTRKSPLGLMDKKAVAVGGGLTHRLGLFDAILIKDNHLHILNQSQNIDELLEKYLTVINESEAAFLEIECDDQERFLEIIKNIKKNKFHHRINKKIILMLDNFSPKEAKKSIQVLEKEGLRQIVFTEISGGVSFGNLKDYARCESDFISTSALVSDCPSIDIGMDFV